MSAAHRLDIVADQVSVRRSGAWALREVSWHLRPGERWALVGHNGSGKTQLLKVLAGEVWPTPTGRESLRYLCGARTVSPVEAKRRIAYVGAESQDRYSRHGWDLPVEDIVATGLHGTDLLLSPVTAAQRRSVTATLRACGLEGIRSRRFLSLSYGQKRLALLARATVGRPDWLLLDELYNGLDPAWRGRIDRLLDRERRRGQSWVVAAHRLEDVPRGTARVVELRDGRVARSAALGRGALAPAGRGPRPRAGPRMVPAPRSPGVELLRIESADLYVDYRLVLRDINWRLRAGEHWAVTGANGSGKSSFLKLLYGDLWPEDGGRIVRRGVRAGTPVGAWKRRIGYVSPELQTDYQIDASLLELVASGRHASIGLNDAPDAADLRAARRWLRFFGLTELAARRPRELSYGQLRRALIARALAGNPRLLLLDEPLTGLDPQQRAMMRELLSTLMRGTVTLVMAVHHRDDLPPGVRHELRLARHRAQPAGAAQRRLA